MVTTKSNKSLTIKQENFCRFYVDTGNASEAYRMAYNCENMKNECIWTNASKLLKNTKVTLRIDEIKQERKEASKVTRERVEGVLMDIINNDPADIYLEDSKNPSKIRIKSPTQMSKTSRNSLKKISNNRGHVSYEFSSKVEAARLVGQWNGWDAPTDINLKNESEGTIVIGLKNRD